MEDADTPEEEYDEEEEEEDERTLSRRRFLKLGLAAAGVAGVAAIGGGIATGLIKLGGGSGLHPWETSRGVVDYSRVPESISSNTLKIAQWYDYWPGRFLTNFKDYIQEKYGRTVELRVDIYTNNEELFTWITQSGRKYDLMFPTNYMAQIMDRAGLLVNVNEDWLPNLQNLADGTKTAANGRTLGDFLTPAGTPYAFRANGARYCAPYQWGTTGIGYNTNVFTEADIRGLGWEVFRETTWSGTTLRGRMGMLDDMRETLGVGMKTAGWDEQIAAALTPTGIPSNPVAPYNGEYQWTENETEAAKVAKTRDVILGFKPNLLGFNTQNQGPNLRDEITYAYHGWSGDIIYAIQPYSQTAYPVSYILPKQGSARWVDNAVIHRESANLWLVHEFINYFLDAYQGKVITDWNLYATPNLESYDALAVYPAGCTPGTCHYDPKEDPRIYPSSTDLALCDYQRDVGVDATQRQYIPAWNDIKFG
jgi:spermidine/putrescine transport system substrate-binding protein